MARQSKKQYGMWVIRDGFSNDQYNFLRLRIVEFRLRDQMEDLRISLEKYPTDVLHAQHQAKVMLESIRDTHYVEPTEAGIDLKWQSDRKNGHNNFYGCNATLANFNEESAKLLNRVLKVTSGDMSRYFGKTQPREFSEKLIDAGFHVIDSLRIEFDSGCHGFIDHITTPAIEILDRVLPIEQHEESVA